MSKQPSKYRRQSGNRPEQPRRSEQSRRDDQSRRPEPPQRTGSTRAQANRSESARSEPAQPANTFPLQLTGMAHGGSAIGKHEGRAIFVPYGAPGDLVTVRITEDKGRFARAEIVEVNVPSEDRVTPRCPYFGPEKCGGCQLQHISYEAQLRLKTGIVADQLARIGGLTDPHVLPMIASADPWNYRVHVTFHGTQEGALGFVTADDQYILPVDDCFIIRPELVDLLQAFNEPFNESGSENGSQPVLSLADSLPPSDNPTEPDEVIDFGGQLDRVRMQVGSDPTDRVIAFSTKDNAIPSLTVDLPVSMVFLPWKLDDDESDPELLIGKPTIEYEIMGKTFSVTAGGFFQANLSGAESLVQQVLQYAALTGSEHVLDLYAGAGLFTAFLADHSAQVVSVESYPQAVHDAERNLSAYTNTELAQGLVEDALPQIEGHFEVIVLDPPRAGMEGAALDAMVAKQPDRIVYVSCDIATFARDAKRLTAQGYTLIEVQPVDMFPQTASIELVSLFTRT